MKEFTINTIQPNDLFDLAFVHNEQPCGRDHRVLCSNKSWRDTYGNSLPKEYINGYTVERRLNEWQEKIKRDSKNTLVIKHSDRIIGFCSFGSYKGKTAAKVGEVYALYLDPDFQGKGAGAILLDNAITKLHAMGYTKVILWVLTKNAKARLFYEKNGWFNTGETRMELRDNVYRIHQTKYSKSL